MSKLQDMLRVQARLHRKQGANALGDLFDNASKEIESLRTQLAKANEREKRLEKILQRYESEQLQPLKLRVKELEQCVIKFRQGVTHFNRTRGDLNVLLSAYADCEKLRKEIENA